MSGGSLNYAYLKIEDVAQTIRSRNISTLHNAFANHLFEVAKALYDIEWVLSCDKTEGDDIESIKKVIKKEAHLKQTIKEAKEISAVLKALLSGD